MKIDKQTNLMIYIVTFRVCIFIENISSHYCNEICILDFLEEFLIIINNLENFIEYEFVSE